MNILVNEVTGRWQRIPEGETHHLEGDASEYGCGISIRGFTTGEREREKVSHTTFRRRILGDSLNKNHASIIENICTLSDGYYFCSTTIGYQSFIIN